MLTAGQVRWAMDHDWFVACQDRGQIIVAEWWRDRSGRSGVNMILWDQSFAALRAWAGY